MLVQERLPPAPPEGIIFVSGEFLPDSQATISTLDHGLSTATAASTHGAAAMASSTRWMPISTGCTAPSRASRSRTLRMPKAEMRIIETVHRNAVADFYIKVLVTRGISPHPVIDPRKCGEPSVVIYACPQQYEMTPEKLGSGIRIKVLALRKLSHEGMFLGDRGYACECPGFNIAAIEGNTLFTPSRGILVGITRGTVMEMARDAGMEVQTGFYTVFDFTGADEVMMTNTVAGIAPVTNIDGWTIGDGRPGKRTMAFQETHLKWLETGRHGTQVFPAAWT